MMRTQYFCCMGCGLNCSLINNQINNNRFCHEEKLVIWPDENYYFKIAINELIFKPYHRSMREGIIVIDFSSTNLHLLIHEQWLQVLNNIALPVLLVVEQIMLPLANYWVKNNRKVYIMVVQNSQHSIFNRKFSLIQQNRYPLPYQGPVFTEREVMVLRARSEGNSTKAIARRLGCSVKSVYQHQYSIGRKFGGAAQLRRLRAMHALV
jgi:DNA-binding CsgD family transcriptional regulator